MITTAEDAQNLFWELLGKWEKPAVVPCPQIGMLGDTARALFDAGAVLEIRTPVNIVGGDMVKTDPVEAALKRYVGAVRTATEKMWTDRQVPASVPLVVSARIGLVGQEIGDLAPTGLAIHMFIWASHPSLIRVEVKI